jgi:hypothetical protein
MEIEPAVLIVTALGAGAAAALQDGVKEAVKNGYVLLRDSLKKRLAGRPDGQLALDRYQTAPETWENVLTAELVKAGAGDDASLVEAARVLLQLVDEAGPQSENYNVTIYGGQGNLFGNHNTQTNTFTNP